MRTTLTIDDDMADILRQKAAQQGRSLKEVVNDLLRAGLGATGHSTPDRKRVKVIGKPPTPILPGFPD
jgi:plasmid stability protein